MVLKCIIQFRYRYVTEVPPLNLDSLMIRLKDYKVTEKWHQFGEALGVEKEVLDRCLNYPPEQSIMEVLDHWLRSCDL